MYQDWQGEQQPWHWNEMEMGAGVWQYASFVLEQEAIEPCSTFVVKDLNELYIKNLKSFGIEEKVQTTRFTQQLLNSIPNLVSGTVNKNTFVCLEIKLMNSL